MIEPARKPALSKPAHRSGTKDGMLLAAFVIFAGAMGAVLHLVLDAEPEMAALAALSSLSVLVAINAVVRRSSMAAQLDAEIADLRSEIANLKSRPQPRGFADRTPAELIGQAPPLPVGRPMRAPPPPTVATPASALETATPPVALDPSMPPLPPRLDTPPPIAPEARTLSADPRLADPHLAAPNAPREPAMSPYWAVRPGTRREPQRFPGVDSPAIGPARPVTIPTPMMAAAPLPEVPDAKPQAPPLPEPATAAAPMIVPDEQIMAVPLAEDAIAGLTDAIGTVVGASSKGDALPQAETEPVMAQWPQAQPRTATQPLDLGTMQSLIEQLATQLNQPRMSDDAPGTEAATMGAEASTASDSGAEPGLPQLSRSSPAAGPHPNWQASAGIGGRPTMRRLTLAPASMAPVGRLALIAEAVEANRMDIYLDPILGLADRKARHFELSVQLLTETGEELGAGEYTGPAGGTGLLARIDSAKLARAAEVAQRLKLRGSHASLFSNIAGESLADENFIGAFSDILDAEDGLGAKLVLTFTQADARTFTGAHWQAISAMSEIGLKFALEDVRDLDMDFALLRHHGFDFVKLDAAVFLDGLPTPSGHIPAIDICRHLAELGLGVIVGGIVEERDLAKILGFGALLGQGTLFGAPRSVQLDVERRAA